MRRKIGLIKMEDQQWMNISIKIRKKGDWIVSKVGSKNIFLIRKEMKHGTTNSNKEVK